MSFIKHTLLPSFALADISFIDTIVCAFVYLLHKLLLRKKIHFHSRFDYKLYLLRNAVLLGQLCIAAILYRSNTYLIAIYCIVVVQFIPNLYKLLLCKHKVQKFLYIGNNAPDNHLLKLGIIVNQLDFSVSITQIRGYLLKKSQLIILNNPKPNYLKEILEYIPKNKIRIYSNNQALTKPTINHMLNSAKLPHIGYPKFKNITILSSNKRNDNKLYKKLQCKYINNIKYIKYYGDCIIDVSLLDFNCEHFYLNKVFNYAKAFNVDIFIMIPVNQSDKLAPFRKMINDLSNIHLIQVPYFISNNECIAKLMSTISNSAVFCNKEDIIVYCKYILGLGKRCPKYVELLYGDMLTLDQIKTILADS